MDVVRLRTEARRVLLAINPRAGARSRRAQVDHLRQLLKQADFEVHEPQDLDELRGAAEEGVRDGSLRAVVAGGGDGTAALIAHLTPPGTPLLMVPLGTENLLSREFGLTAKPEEALETLKQGVAVLLDAGEANGRLFLLMASVGFDADVVRRAHANRRGHIRRWSYAKPILDSIRSYEYPGLRVYCSESSESAIEQPPIEASWAFVANLPCYAAGLRVVPDAVGDDSLLDVSTFRHGSLLSGLKYVAGVALGRHQAWDDCVTTRAKRVRIEADQAVPYQLDGDPGGVLPLDIRVLPQRLTLLTPPARPSDSALTPTERR